MKNSSPEQNSDTNPQSSGPDRESRALRDMDNVIQSGITLMEAVPPDRMYFREEAVEERDHLDRKGHALHTRIEAGLQEPGAVASRELLYALHLWFSDIRDWGQRHLSPQSNDALQKKIKPLVQKVEWSEPAPISPPERPERQDEILLQLVEAMNRQNGILRELQAGQEELRTRVGGLETKVDGVWTKVDGLETKVDGLETRVGGLETKVGGLETKVNELRAGQGRLIAPALEEEAKNWPENDFQDAWYAQMNHIVGSESAHWAPPIHLKASWFDGPVVDEEWNAFRTAARLPATVQMSDNEKRCDVYACFEYRLPDGSEHSFLLVGEATVSVDMEHLRRLIEWRNKLLNNDQALPVIACPFSQYTDQDRRRLDFMDRERIVHLYCGHRQHLKISPSQLDQILDRLPELKELAVRPKKEDEWRLRTERA